MAQTGPEKKSGNNEAGAGTGAEGADQALSRR
jgi:hypothetical protein